MDGIISVGMGGAAMNPIHLVWIVPASVMAGIFVAALLRAGRDRQDR